MPEISVIVPVYNTEKYLSRCVDSILAQTFTDLELILVDDGSPDNCGRICDEYAERDSRVKVIHQENGGVSAARNRGLDISTGKYIMFCDSDDYLKQDCLLHLYKCSCGKTSAIIFGGMVDVFMSNGEVQCTNILGLDDSESFQIDALLELKNRDLIGYACNLLFDNGIIQKNHLRFRTDVIVEDLHFVLEYARYMNSLIYTGYADYNYVHDERETRSKKYYKDGYRRWQEKYSITLQYIQNEIPKNRQEIEFTKTADYHLYRFMLSLQNTFDERNNDSILEKIRFNNSILKTYEFQHCLKYAKNYNEDSRIVFLLKHTNYYVVYFFELLVKFKHNLKQLKGKHTK